MVSKITKNKTYHTQIKKLLAVMQFTLRGTPFIFQGDEMGLENYEFDSIEQINDVESRNLYVELCKKMSEKQAFDIIRAGTRDHARILLPFKENKCAFENKTDSSDNSIYSVFAQQQADKEIFEVYKTLIQLRKNNKELVYGDFELLNGKKGRFVYKRGNYLIDCNLSNKKQKAFSVTSDYELVFDTLTAGKGDGEKTLNKKHVLEPYQARVYKR
jgi:oligo-1,6-glucosidase